MVHSAAFGLLNYDDKMRSKNPVFDFSVLRLTEQLISQLIQILQDKISFILKRIKIDQKTSYFVKFENGSVYTRGFDSHHVL